MIKNITSGPTANADIQTTADGRKLSVREAADFLRISKSFLDKTRLSGSGPQFLKLGRRVIYDARDLESWAASRRRRHTGG